MSEGGGSISIVGWSPYHHSNGVTGHLLAIGSFISAYYGIDVGIRADHFGSQPIEAYIEDLHRLPFVSNRREFYASPDNPCYLKYYYTYRDNYRKVINRFGDEFHIGERLVLYQPVESEEAGAFASDMKTKIKLLDASGGNSRYNFTVIQSADMLIVFLPCNAVEIRHFYQMYSEIAQRAFIVINRFSKEEGSAVERVLNEFGCTAERYAMIEYSFEFESACRYGNVYGMMNQFITKGSKSTYLKQIKKISNFIVNDC